MSETQTTEIVAIGKCIKCKSPISHVWADRTEAALASYQVRSACCKRWSILKFVEGKVSAKPCGSHCEEATSAKCTCECGGRQHGIAWRVK